MVANPRARFFEDSKTATTGSIISAHLSLKFETLFAEIIFSFFLLHEAAFAAFTRRQVFNSGVFSDVQ
jgi:hypothetical protein